MTISGTCRDSAGELEPLALPRGSQVDAGEEHGQLRRLNLDPVSSSDLGHLEGAGLKPLISDGQAVTVEVEDLDPIPATVEEEEEMTGQQVLAEAFLNQARKAVEALAEVGRSRTEENPDGRGEQDHGDGNKDAARGTETRTGRKQGRS
jgi:hypothetical protein